MKYALLVLYSKTNYYNNYYNITHLERHPLINVCDVLRPPILVIYYGRLSLLQKTKNLTCIKCICTVLPTVVYLVILGNQVRFLTIQLICERRTKSEKS